MKKLLIFGAGGHAKVIIDAAEKSKLFHIEGVVESNDKMTQPIFFGYPVISESKLKIAENLFAVVAIGDNTTRAQVAEKISKTFPKLQFASIIHPSAKIGRDVEIYPGTVIMPGAVINSGTTIGQHSIVNSRASIDHDCHLGDFSSIGPGCTLGGNVRIGNYSAISLGANIIHGISIGDHVVIGAGSTVVKPIPNNVVAFGTPCKTIRSRANDAPYL